MKRTGFSILALLLVASMILTACGATRRADRSSAQADRDN